MGDVWGWEVDFRPFSDEVSKSLRLNSSAGDLPDVMAHELKCPFRDSSHGIAVANDVSQRVRSDDDDLVLGEVVSDLPGHHQNGV